MTGVTLGTEGAYAKERTSSVTILGVIAALALVGAQAFGVLTSPPDRDMGHLQKIMYVHVPGAWAYMVCFIVVFISSARYLFSRDDRHDLLAASAVEVGGVFTAMTLMLGSIWGRPTWGVWWTWDARLTATAVQMVLVAGYLALRSMTDDPERRAQWCSAVGILSALNVPIVYMSVRWWRTLHQVQSSPSTVDPQYAWGLRANGIAVLLVASYFIAKRYQAAKIERAAEQAFDAQALSR
jgi:heme exporter protein C